MQVLVCFNKKIIFRVYIGVFTENLLLGQLDKQNEMWSDNLTE